LPADIECERKPIGGSDATEETLVELNDAATTDRGLIC
jgi:hypothetical protein